MLRALVKARGQGLWGPREKKYTSTGLCWYIGRNRAREMTWLLHQFDVAWQVTTTSTRQRLQICILLDKWDELSNKEKIMQLRSRAWMRRGTHHRQNSVVKDSWRHSKTTYEGILEGIRSGCSMWLFCDHYPTSNDLLGYYFQHRLRALFHLAFVGGWN